MNIDLSIDAGNWKHRYHKTEIKTFSYSPPIRSPPNLYINLFKYNISKFELAEKYFQLSEFESLYMYCIIFIGHLDCPQLASPADGTLNTTSLTHKTEVILVCK